MGEVVRARVLGVLRRAYSALTPSRAAALLGLPEPEAIACEHPGPFFKTQPPFPHSTYRQYRRTCMCAAGAA